MNLPEKGDPTREVTYAAVGFALTRWESLEAELCGLLAAFLGVGRGSPEAVERYSKGKIFAERLEALEAVGNEHFIKKCNQQREARFQGILSSARAMSAYRNNIAHGMVVVYTYEGESPQQSHVDQTSEPADWCLIAPYYNKRNVDRGQKYRSMKFAPTYFYVSREIRAFGVQFRELTIEVMEYSVGLDPPWFPPLPRKRVSR